MTDEFPFYFQIRFPGNIPKLPRLEPTGLTVEEKADFDRGFMPNEMEIGHRLHSAVHSSFADAVTAVILFDQHRAGVNQWLPPEFAARAPLIYAKAFLFACDAVGRILATLTREDYVPEPTKAACRAFADVFPGLKGLRDTAHHPEDRIRFKREYERDIVVEDGGAMYLDQLGGDTYSATTADGHRQSIRVNAESVGALHDAIQGVIDSLEWQGPGAHYFPHAS